jgi:hypothetical protein
VYIAHQPDKQRVIQELFVSLLRARLAIFEVAGSAPQLARLRILHERGNNATEIYLADCHS